ncbi:MAG TPA: hypothetical protein VGE93_07100, partial [Bryobacteraceae bacterium]
DMNGTTLSHSQQFFEVGPTVAKNYLPIGHHLDRLRAKEGIILSLRLLDVHQKIVSDNLYWLPDSTGVYSGLQHMPASGVAVTASQTEKTRITVTLKNPAGGPVAFFNRVSLVDPKTKERLLPVFYSDNYISVLPGETKTITLDYTPKSGVTPVVSVRGWNLQEKNYPVK